MEEFIKGVDSKDGNSGNPVLIARDIVNYYMGTSDQNANDSC